MRTKWQQKHILYANTGGFRTKVIIKCFCEYKHLFRVRKMGVEEFVSDEALNTHGTVIQGLDAGTKKAFPSRCGKGLKTSC